MTKQKLRLIVEGRNGTFRLDDFQYGTRVSLNRQCEEAHFLSNLRGRLEKDYSYNYNTRRYEWRSYADTEAIPKRVMELILNPPKQLKEVCRIIHNNELYVKYQTKKVPTWANGIYVTLPPTPILICKDWVMNRFSYRFIEVGEIK
jgi:hypothetical protein